MKRNLIEAYLNEGANIPVQLNDILSPLMRKATGDAAWGLEKHKMGSAVAIYSVEKISRRAIMDALWKSLRLLSKKLGVSPKVSLGDLTQEKISVSSLPGWVPRPAQHTGTMYAYILPFSYRLPDGDWYWTK
jgi:hypothetical protein